MSEIVRCRTCGRTCEKNEGGAGWVGLLFGFPATPSFCCDECRQQWLGGRAWFGRRWRQQVIVLLIAIALIWAFYWMVTHH